MTLEAFRQITIDQVEYIVSEHPMAKGMPYGQEGRKAVVYQLVDSKNTRKALKVFKTRFRVPHMTLVAEKLAPYAGWPGLKACQRTVLTATHYASLISAQPELTYAVLMPWIYGLTWQEVLLGKKILPPIEAISTARSFASVLVQLEEQGLAHCDLSAPNLILTPSGKVELVDLEEMYLPGFIRPGAVPSGSPGYGHRMAASGLWGSTADRFSGGVLLSEMLGWCDERIIQEAWGESYFNPEEMQQECSRYGLMLEVLEQRCGKRIAELFAQAWNSDSLDDCPTLAEWLVAIPEQMAEYSLPQLDENIAADPEIPESVKELIELAKKLQGQGDTKGALLIFEQALKQIPEDSDAATEIKQSIQLLQTHEKPEPQSGIQSEFPLNSQTDSQHNSIHVQFVDAQLAIKTENWPKAEELLEAVVTRDPEYREQGQKTSDLLAEIRKMMTQPKERQNRSALAEHQGDDKDKQTVGSGSILSKHFQRKPLKEGNDEPVQMKKRRSKWLRTGGLVFGGLALIAVFIFLYSFIRVRVIPAGAYARLGVWKSIYQVVFSPDGKLLANGGYNHTSILSKADNGQWFGKIVDTADITWSVAFSPDGKILASGWSSIFLWDTATGQKLRTLSGFTSSALSLAFSPNGKILASGLDDGTIILWDTANWQKLLTLSGHTRYVHSVAFSPDGQMLASGSYDGTVILWNSVTGQKLRTINVDTGEVCSVVFSPDGKTLASGSWSNAVFIWDIATGQKIRAFIGQNGDIKSVVFSSDGKMLASGAAGDNTVVLWDVASGHELRTLSGHVQGVFGVSFSPDGKTLASGSDDGTIILWNVP